MTFSKTRGRWRHSMTDRYVELHAASAFSFLEGASEPEKLIERALELGMPAMALLDRNGVYGSARFHTSARRNELRAHVGAEVSVASRGSRLAARGSRLRCGCRINT
jgi:error-prone DNA polymerase